MCSSASVNNPPDRCKLVVLRIEDAVMLDSRAVVPCEPRHAAGRRRQQMRASGSASSGRSTWRAEFSGWRPGGFLGHVPQCEKMSCRDGRDVVKYKWIPRGYCTCILACEAPGVPLTPVCAAVVVDHMVVIVTSFLCPLVSSSASRLTRHRTNIYATRRQPSACSTA